MPYSEQDYKDACPLCAKGIKVRCRTDTGEFVHDYVINKLTNGVVQGHTLCGANKMRRDEQR